MALSTQTSHRIWYDTAGDTGSRVLLVMGYTMRGRAWRFQIREFQKHHQIAWFDHAGLGRSGPIEEPLLRMEHLAADAIGVMDDLGWDDAHVVGISMGGMISQHIALNAPDRVQSLTLAATHSGGVRAALPTRTGIGHFLRANRAGLSRDERAEALRRLLFGEQFRNEQRELLDDILQRDFGHPPPRGTQLAQLHAITRHRARRRLSQIRHQTLVVQPTGDLLIKPENSEVLAAEIPNARLVRFEGAGHAVTRECAERFNEVVLEHIATRSPHR